MLYSLLIYHKPNIWFEKDCMAEKTFYQAALQASGCSNILETSLQSKKKNTATLVH